MYIKLFSVMREIHKKVIFLEKNSCVKQFLKIFLMLMRFLFCKMIDRCLHNLFAETEVMFHCLVLYKKHKSEYIFSPPIPSALCYQFFIHP